MISRVRREGQRRVDILARNRQHDLRAGLAAHFLDRLVQRQAAGHGVVDLDDEVARLDARAERRRVLDRGNDLDDAVFDADFDAEAAELALGRDLQFLERIGVEKVGMRVEAVHHAVDGFADQLVVRHRLDVVALDPSEHGGEELQVFVGDRQAGVTLRQGREIEAQQQPENRTQADPSRFLPTVVHLYPHFADCTADPTRYLARHMPVRRDPSAGFRDFRSSALGIQSIRRLSRLLLPKKAGRALNCDELLRAMRGRQASLGSPKRHLSIADRGLTRVVGRWLAAGTRKPTGGARVAQTLAARHVFVDCEKGAQVPSPNAARTEPRGHPKARIESAIARSFPRVAASPSSPAGSARCPAARRRIRIVRGAPDVEARHQVQRVRRVRLAGRRIVHHLDVAVIGGDQHFAAARALRGNHAADALVEDLDRPRRRFEIAGMADHVAVGVIADDRVVAVPLAIAATSLSVTSNALISGLQIVGRDLGRGHHDAVLARIGRLDAAVEEIGDVRVFLGLGDAQLPQAAPATISPKPWVIDCGVKAAGKRANSSP